MSISQAISLLDNLIAQKYQLIEKYKNTHSSIPAVQKILYNKQLKLYQTIAGLKIRKQQLLKLK